MSSESTNPSSSAGSRGRKRKSTSEGRVRRINVTIHSQVDGAETYYVIPVNLPMKDLLLAYCEFKGLEYMAMQFFRSDGKRLLVRSTAEELGFEDGEMIEAMVHCHGGGAAAKANY